MDRNKLKKVFSDDPEVLAKLERQEQTAILKSIFKKELGLLKGDKGDSPTEKELVSLIKPLIPKPIPGEKGDTPVAGVDFPIPKNGEPGRPGEKGDKPVAGIDFPIPKNGNDGSPDTPKEIADKLNTTTESVDAKVIKGLPTLEGIVKDIKKGKLLELRDIKGARLDMSDQRWHGGGSSSGGSGTVTTVSVVTANGVSGSVANATTSPAITLTLGAITPSSVNGVVISGSSTPTITVIGSSSVQGVNVGSRDFGFAIGDGSTALTTGQKGYTRLPLSGNITGWSIIATGSSPTCTIDIWKVASGTILPTGSNSIMGTKPALATGNAIASTTLTNWSTPIAANDIVGYNLDAVSNATFIQFVVTYNKA